MRGDDSSTFNNDKKYKIIITQYLRISTRKANAIYCQNYELIKLNSFDRSPNCCEMKNLSSPEKLVFF